MRPIIRIDRESFRQPDVEGPVLYRCYGLDGTLMYIGRTANLRKRIISHRSATAWWFAVEYLHVQQYRNEKVLDQDEIRAIYVERPFFNKHGKGRSAAAVAMSNQPGQPLWLGTADHFHTRGEHAEDDMFVFPQFSH